MSHAEDADQEQALLHGIRKVQTTPPLRLCYTFKRILPCAVVLGLLIAFLSPTRQTSRSKDEFPADIQHLWAQYAPYMPQDVYVYPPSSCQVDQVHILQRHGARYPTTGASIKITAAISKLQAAERYSDPLLGFLETYTYDLGSNDLLQYGADQSFDAGKEAFQRYSSLVNQDNIPFVRASSSERVVLSATNWTEGFAVASKYRFYPPLSVILSETGNNTLDDKMCPPAGDADTQTTQWLTSYAVPVTAYLNSAAPGADLSDFDTFALTSICPFESYAKGRKSSFCDIFEAIPGAFEGFIYNGDLDKYYGTGYGQRLGPVQGVGYVNELLARLTSSPVHDHTQTNHTLDSSHETFPLNRTIYADFSHDNEMIAIYSALGLFKQPEVEPLSLEEADDRRVWRVAEIVPFSGRMVVERLECVVEGPTQDKNAHTETAIRILVNDRVQSLPFCQSDAHGLCLLDRFIRSQEYARQDGQGDWEICVM